MILTVTMNPSVDISYPLGRLQLDTVNRVIDTRKTPGGKGLNVTRVLAQLGDQVVASGFLGGKIGEFIETELDKVAIKHDFYKIQDETRNCIAILHEGQQTEILEQGPTISEVEAKGFLAHFEGLLPKLDIVSISGSLPKGLGTDYYTEMISLLCPASGAGGSGLLWSPLASSFGRSSQTPGHQAQYRGIITVTRL